MEKRITVHNPTAMPIYVGSNMIPPGETRDFAESTVPPHLRPQEAAEEPAAEEPALDLIANLQKLSIKDIVTALADLSTEDLARLEELENADGSPRKGLMTALVEEKLKRAAADQQQNQDPDGDPSGGNGDGGDAGSNG